MNLFLPSDYSAVRLRLMRLFPYGGSRQKSLVKLESIATLTAAIASGMGVAVLPESAARSLCGAVNGVDVSITTPSMSLSLSLNLPAKATCHHRHRQ
ncbi:hypothetical protein ACNKHM_23900 [Shigella sonnei]